MNNDEKYSYKSVNSSEGSLNQHVKLKHPDYVGAIIQTKLRKNTGDINSEQSSFSKVISIYNTS